MGYTLSKPDSQRYARLQKRKSKRAETSREDERRIESVDESGQGGISLANEAESGWEYQEHVKLKCVKLLRV